jgi:hypothetical protein
MPAKGLAHHEHGSQVHLNDVVPFFEVNIFRPLSNRRAGTIDKDVDAFRCSNYVPKMTLYYLYVRQVISISPDFFAGLILNLSLRSIKLFFIAGHNYDVRPLLGQSSRYGKADAPAAPRNQRRLSQ